MANSNQTTLDTKLNQIAKDAFLEIVSPMVKHEADVECVGIHFNSGTLYLEPRCNEEDKGQLIGAKQGNYKAIQTLFALVGVKNGTNFELLPLAPSVKGTRALPRPFHPSMSFRLEEAETMLERLMNLILEMDFQIERETKHGEINFVVTIDRNEGFTTEIEDVVFALSKVMHAIGRMRGRILYVKERDK